MPDRQIEPKSPSKTWKVVGIVVLLLVALAFVLVPVARQTFVG